MALFPTSPTDGEYTTVNGITYVYASATFSWTRVPGSGGGGGTPGGSDQQVQYNNAGSFGASAGLTFNYNTNALATTGTFTSTGNVTGGNIVTAGQVAATGNVTGGNLITGAQVVATGNITGGNLITGAQVVATGNITGGNLITGAQVVATGNITGGNLITAGLGSFGTTVTSTGNITGGNLITGAQVVATGNITGGNLITSGLISATGNITGGGHVGTIYTNSIINTGANGTGNIGSSSLYFNTAFIKATSAQYADLAEMYLGDESYMPGTVVEFGGRKEITITTELSSTRIAGVVSTNPSYLMNSGLTELNSVPIALTGRVPCQVIGPVRKGDRLVSSMFPGVAQALDEETYRPGCIIGKSLEDWPEATVKSIEVVVGRL